MKFGKAHNGMCCMFKMSFFKTFSALNFSALNVTLDSNFFMCFSDMLCF